MFFIFKIVILGEGNDNSLQHSCLEIPWTEEPGGLQTMGSQRVGHDLVTEQQQQRKLYLIR